MELDRGAFRRATVLVGALLAMSVHAAAPRQDPGHGFTTADIEAGGQTYLRVCASCHGPNGDLLPGVDVAGGTFRRATSDQELAALLRRGIPGTAMPPNSLSEAEALQVVGYLRAWPLAAAARAASTARTPAAVGTAATGGALYATLDCASCHLIGGRGGYLGPDLSSVGITRPADELQRSLTNPSADLRIGTRTVRIVSGTGVEVLGRLLNHDTYSVQFIDSSGRLTSVRKDAVRRWEVMEVSAMPNYSSKLSPQETADLVAYLLTQKAPAQAGGVAGTPRGGGARAGGPAAPPAAGRGGRGTP